MFVFLLIRLKPTSFVLRAGRLEQLYVLQSGLFPLGHSHELLSRMGRLHVQRGQPPVREQHRLRVQALPELHAHISVGHVDRHVLQLFRLVHSPLDSLDSLWTGVHTDMLRLRAIYMHCTALF